MQCNPVAVFGKSWFFKNSFFFDCYCWLISVIVDSFICDQEIYIHTYKQLGNL